MTGYVTITRQQGLLREMDIVANNIANLSTTGFRREGTIFSEYVHRLKGSEGVSMGAARVRVTDLAQGPLAPTGGTFDFAIEGEGFFQIDTPAGLALTRAGSFSANAAGELVTPDGHRLLDSGGAPVFVPPDAQGVRLSTDGTLSADGLPLAQIGLVLPADPLAMTRRDGTLFRPGGGVVPAEGGATILQRYLERSNVNPVAEISRMIEVQRAYEMGARFQEREGERLRSLIDTLGRQ